MRKPIRTSFDELVQQNKKEILQDQKAISLIEAKLDAKHEQRREENSR
ncbi:MAG: FbpB family small basic protein [Alkalicoccus sp.]|nr:MAG: FbpB family small basic protein [Alkalicoccus sp.]